MHYSYVKLATGDYYKLIVSPPNMVYVEVTALPCKILRTPPSSNSKNGRI